ncbi:MAG: hypothetical protein JRJ10_15925 [Deltaproteobacteria bacterium]|nr:hypothetical protein [Deltaproteobacteria bacterium]
MYGCGFLPRDSREVLRHISRCLWRSEELDRPDRGRVGNGHLLDRSRQRDAYGVLKSSTGLIEGALETVTSLIAAGKEVFVVTNDSSRSPESMAERYAEQAGGELLPPERYISSGLLAAEYLEKQIPYGKVSPRTTSKSQGRSQFRLRTAHSRTTRSPSSFSTTRASIGSAT